MGPATGAAGRTARRARSGPPPAAPERPHLRSGIRSRRPVRKRDRPGARAPDERGRAPDDAEGVCGVPSWECLPQLRVAPSGRRSRGGQVVPATIADEARPIVGSWSLDLASLGTGSLPAAEQDSRTVPLATVTPRAARPPPPNHDGMLVPESCAVPLSSSCCSEARAAPPGVPRAPGRADQDGGRIRTVLTFGVDLASQDRLAASRTSEPCPPPSSASPASGTRAAHPSPGSSPPTRSSPRPFGRHNLIPARDTRPDDYDDGSYDPRHGQPPCASPVGQRVRSRGERRGAGPDGAGPGRGYEGAGPVVRRSTRVTGRTSRSGTRGAPEISPTIRSTARVPISASGWWMVVSPTKSAASTSS